MSESIMKWRVVDTKLLVYLLRDMADRIEKGDSLEGEIRYDGMDVRLNPGEWCVGGMYRIGNSEGQGGWRVLFEEDCDDKETTRTDQRSSS